MSVLYVVLPLALLLAGGALGVCVWAIRSGQFDDLETPAWRAILDDDEVRPAGQREPHAAPDREP
jgi:cbb3-type cytochrome oxidase maturation protein